MTATAQGFPSIQVGLVDVRTKLSDEQLARVEALHVAREVLENKPGLFVGSKIDGTRSVYDLISLAEWIEQGSSTFDTPEPTEPDIADGSTAQDHFNEGWNAHRREVLSVSDAVDPKSGVEWSREHPAENTKPDASTEAVARLATAMNLPPDILSVPVAPTEDKSVGPW
jgi:hypothetical protein